MSNFYVIQMRFNRLPHGWDWALKHTLQNVEWWTKRWQIWQETSRKSLQAQTDSDFEVWAVFDKQINWAFPHIQALADKFESDPFVKVIYEDSNRSVSKVAYQETCRQEYEQHDNIFIFNLDCDDMLHKEAMAIIKKHPLLRGTAMIMMDGFMWSQADGQMREYKGRGAPGPFWGINFPREARTSREDAMRYLYQYSLDNEHFQMPRAKLCHKLPKNLFVQVIHGDNTTTAWDNKATAGHLGQHINAQKRDEIIKNCGL